jgi:Myb/SANT-like DNA-binding domain
MESSQKRKSVDENIVKKKSKSNSDSSSRNPAFDKNETEILLKAWGESDIQERFNKVNKHGPIWEKIATDLYEMGKDDNGNHRFKKRSADECKNKFRNLKRVYTSFNNKLRSGLF